MNIEQIEKGIEKTGFRLEFDVSSILSNNNWNIINNKYYVDDQQETVREIDIVAYKVSSLKGIFVYTVMIVSCKKSDENSWVLLSKDPNHNDPNMQWVPVHAWSNDKILKYMFDEQEWKEPYLSVLKDNSLKIVSDKPKRHIFGFQEMSKKNGSPQNDKNIFNSITSLMKAQAYEMNALPLRKKDPCVFQFNLVSIAKTDLIRLDFVGDEIKGIPVDDEIYVAGYIVDKQQTFAKIHFINADKFESTLGQYNKLHECNIKGFDKVYDKFSKDITKDYNKLNLFRNDVGEDLWWPLLHNFDHFIEPRKLLKEGWLSWNENDGVIEFQLALDSRNIEGINSDDELRKELSKSVKKHYGYEGKTRFAEYDIPF